MRAITQEGGLVGINSINQSINISWLLDASGESTDSWPDSSNLSDLCGAHADWQ